MGKLEINSKWQGKVVFCASSANEYGRRTNFVKGGFEDGEYHSTILWNINVFRARYFMSTH